MTLQERVLTYTTMLFLLSAGTSFAAHPLISDDAGTLGKGNMQVELNGEIGTDKETTGGSTTKSTGRQVASSFGIGVTDKIDVALGVTRPWGNGDVDGASFNDAGSADFSLAMKWQVYEHERLSVAVKPQFGYSYAVGATDDHAVSYGAALVISKEFEPFAVHLNIGYTYNDYNLADVRDASRSSVMSYSLAGTCEVIKNLKLVADVGAATNEDKTSSDTPVFGLGGMIYSPDKSLDLSAALKIGLTKPETDLTGLLGVTRKF
ncbi:MAG: transporter [Pelobacteraceae bacterium]